MAENLSLVGTYHVNNGDIPHTTAQLNEYIANSKIKLKFPFDLGSSVLDQDMKTL